MQQSAGQAAGQPVMRGLKCQCRWAGADREEKRLHVSPDGAELIENQ
jgi:hypothetical protein